MGQARGWSLLALVAAAAVPAGVLRLLLEVFDLHLVGPGPGALVFGASIVAAAFLLSWASEVAQLDISQALALAFLALVAVLPEYAVDLYFAWQAGAHPEGPYASYAAANMTGANRLLVGLGWPLVVLLFWVRRRQSAPLGRGLALELVFMGLASLYAFTIPLKGSIALWDSVVLFGIFALYIFLSARTEHVEPELMGPPRAIAGLRPGRRRLTVVLLFLFSALTIFASAEPFAESLLETGETFGIDKFILVQWVAPLASESPEILVASIFSLRGQPQAALTAVISSMVNQWTLLVGSIPIAYTVSLGQFAPSGLPLDARQVEEIWLTAGQSLFAVLLLAPLRFTFPGALALLLLWGTQLGFTSTSARFIYLFIYLGGALGLVALLPGQARAAVRLWPTMRDSLHRPNHGP
jgi:cation:H+ antiporter